MPATTPTGYQRILAAVDFSPHSEAAVKQAVWLARTTGARLTLAQTLPDLRKAVHSVSHQAKVDLLYGEGSLFQRELRQASDSRLRQLIADLQATDLDVQVETLLGAPYAALTHAVQREGYDLVLAGTRGMSPWTEFFVGSTAKRLVRKCPAAVWIVKAEQACPPRAVLAATDFSEVSRRAVLAGLWIAEQAAAEFHLLHVIDDQDLPADFVSRAPEGETLRRVIQEESQRRFDEFVASLPVAPERITRHVTDGSPWREVGRLARELRIDLIALGTVGRGGLRGLLLGNTAEQVLSTCDCGVLTVKPEGFVSPVDPASWPLHPETSDAATTDAAASSPDRSGPQTEG